MRVVIESVSTVDEVRRIHQRGLFGAAELILALGVFLKRQATFGWIARLAQIGRYRRQVIKGDVRADVDTIAQQQLAQERDFHRLAFRVVGNGFAHVARADAVIDRIVEPIPMPPQHVADVRFAKSGHGKKQDTLAWRIAPVGGRGINHASC